MRLPGWKSAAATALALVLHTVPIHPLPAAYAADMLQEPVDVTQVEFGTGWYLRGDIGYAAKAVVVETDFGGVAGQDDLGHPLSWGLAAGYKLDTWARAEVGFNHFTGLQSSSRTSQSCGNEDIVGQDAFGNPTVTTVPITGDCFYASNATPSALSLMANAYVDGPEFWNFTPYVGAGLGFAYVTWNDFEARNICLGTAPSDCGASGTAGYNEFSSGTFNTEGEFAFAYNLMVGTGVKLTKNATLDLGYRYTNIGGVEILSAAANPGVTGDRSTGPMEIHEFRVGLRYEIW
ncbi:MAG: outer membrane beta-barrel protein [Pseudomonadota bacterium]